MAEKLGVSQELVTDVCNDSIGTIITHDRVTAQEYYEGNPDASYREVARQVDGGSVIVRGSLSTYRWITAIYDQ